ncbi:hypothetical protein L1987_13452 [Smallanthus sonchifolius]|uniref:Uncharacterized protein n=1 Tax=Smallanthus sonchifolius TaxID=185202 RepID=A0ACB9JIQ1_9ASTR|nr:hypothetical protein L1987_13452 [Smallanthus sonchifolius]
MSNNLNPYNQGSDTNLSHPDDSAIGRGVTGKVQAHNMNLRKKESSGRPQIQDPSMYHGTSSTTKSSGTRIALFSGNSTEEDHSNGCGGHACYASGLAEDPVALFSSCMLAYQNFIGDKLTDPETIEEDFNQVDPDDMEDMDIQWNIAMILRRAKRQMLQVSELWTLCS